MSEAAAGWRRISRGLYLMGFGVLLLLTTHDVLGAFFWIDALSFWPILLVGFGIRMIFERSRTPWLILLSPLVVFTALGWLALSNDGTARDWRPVALDAGAPVERWSLTGRMAMVGLDLHTEPLPEGRLLDGRLSGEWSTSPRVRVRGAEARVDIGGWYGRRVQLLVPGIDQAWELGLSPLPLSLSLRGGFSSGDVDLVDGMPTRIGLEGAFHRIRFRLGAPEQDVRFDIEGAFNDIEIVVPASTPVGVSTRGFINVTDGRDDPPRNDLPGYRLHVHGFMNHIEIIPEPDALPPSDAQAGPAGPPAPRPAAGA